MAIWHDKGNSGFWAAHDLLFEQQAELNDAAFRSIARRLGGLDFRRIVAGMREKRHGEAILRDVTLAERVDVNQTPTVFINGRRIVGAQPLETYDAVLREELEKAEALVDTGTPRAALYARLIANGRQLEPPSDLPEATE
jgi:protein-disulfide isomerase